jgi:hypothetical protein
LKGGDDAFASANFKHQTKNLKPKNPKLPKGKKTMFKFQIPEVNSKMRVLKVMKAVTRVSQLQTSNKKPQTKQP